MKKNAIVLGLMLLSFAACKKEDAQPDNNNSGNINATRILTSGTWKIVSRKTVVELQQPRGMQTIDFFAGMRPCLQDNTFTFRSDQTVLTDEGLKKCSPSDPQQYASGTWILSQNGTKLNLIVDGESMDANVRTLDSETLEIRYVTSYGGLNSMTTTIYGR